MIRKRAAHAALGFNTDDRERIMDTRAAVAFEADKPLSIETICKAPPLAVVPGERADDNNRYE